MYEIKCWKHYYRISIFYTRTFSLSWRKCYHHNRSSDFNIVVSPFFCVQFQPSLMWREIWNKMNHSSQSEIIRHILKKLFKNHASHYPKNSTIPLSLRKRITVVFDIDWYFMYLVSILHDFFYKFTRILHPIHSKSYFFDNFSVKESIAIMSISKMNSGDNWGKYSSSIKGNFTIPWNVWFGLHDKSRPIDYIGMWMFL